MSEHPKSVVLPVQSEKLGKWVFVSAEPGVVSDAEDGRVEERDRISRRRGDITDDEKRSSVEQAPEQPRLVMHRALRGVGRATKPIQAWLSYYQNTAGAANTAFAWSCQLQPNLDSSFASWQSVFDEMKVLSADIHWNVWFNTLPSAFAAQAPNAIVVYEPSDSVNLTSINQGMEYEHFQLLAVGANSNGTYAVSPQSTSKGGYLVFKAKVPRAVSLSNVTTVLSAGLWRPTIDAQNYTWGAFSGYVSVGGTTSVLQVQAFVRMRVEFRVRR